MGNYCFAAGMAQCADGAFYAAAPMGNDEGWTAIFAESHEIDVLQDDGETTKKEWVDEAKNLKALVETGKKPYGGIWFGKQAYKLVQHDKAFEMGETHSSGPSALSPKEEPILP